MLRTLVCAVAVVVGMTAGAGEGRAIVCSQCAGSFGCDDGGAALLCVSGKFFDIPYCVALGACVIGEPSVDGGFVRPRFGARAAGGGDVGATAPAGERRIGLYLMRMPIRAGFDPFPSGSSSFVARATREPRTAHGMLAAVASRAHVTRERIPLCEESAAVGGGRFDAAFAAGDGDGFVLHAEPSGALTRLRLCTLRGGQNAGVLADALVGEDDVLFARVRGEGREYALVIAASHSDAADGLATARQRDARAAFHDEAGPLTAHAPYDGVRFMPVPAPAGDCR